MVDRICCGNRNPAGPQEGRAPLLAHSSSQPADTLELYLKACQQGLGGCAVGPPEPTSSSAAQAKQPPPVPGTVAT